MGDDILHVGPPSLLWPPALSCSFLARVGSETRACVRLQPFRAPRLLRGTCLAPSSLGMAARLAVSLATLEDAVVHGVQTLLVVLLESAVPLPAIGLTPRNALLRPPFALALRLPKARGSILPSQCGPTGLSVKSCPAAPLLLALSSPTWTSSWLPWVAGLPWTSSPSLNKTALSPNLIHCLAPLGTLFGSKPLTACSRQHRWTRTFVVQAFWRPEFS